jgi:hypothetical protein
MLRCHCRRFHHLTILTNPVWGGFKKKSVGCEQKLTPMYWHLLSQCIGCYQAQYQQCFAKKLLKCELNCSKVASGWTTWVNFWSDPNRPKRKWSKTHRLSSDLNLGQPG